MGANFDTHASVKTLAAAGMPETQAEAVISVLGGRGKPNWARS
jgi:hypothetical protein